MIQAEHHRAEPEAVPDQEPRRVTIDMLRHPSIRETVTRAAAIAPPPIRSIGVTRWTARAVDLMEATAADACALKQRAGNKRWRIRAKWHTLTCTFYWQPDPPADEPAVIHEAVDVLRAGELQAAIVRGAKATKSLDTMRARILKADEARTDAAHEARAAQVAEAATEAATDNRHAAEAWDALATHAAKHAGACRHGAALADRTRRRWPR